MEKDYIQMLIDSLDNKIGILEELQSKNNDQTMILSNPNSGPDELDANVDAKSELIDALDKLDEGFEIVFNRVKDILDGNRQQYREQIQIMQDKIRRISDLTADIEAKEHKNRELAVTKFSNVRAQIREVNKSQSAVNTYYQSMSRVNLVDPQFMDKKK